MNGLLKKTPSPAMVPWKWGGRLWKKDFEDFFRGMEKSFREPFRAGLFRWTPKVETLQRKGEFVVKADLPGVDPKDIQVYIEGNHLIIRGERKADRESKKKGFQRKEIFYGSFERMLPLPQGADSGKIKAKYRNGVLEIRFPAEKAQLPKSVKVEVDKAAA